MTNFTSKILGSAISSLNAQQAVIANTSSNIANVNTPGYVKRVVDLQARASSSGGAGVNIGGGVDVGSLRRQTNEFLERVLRLTSGEQGRYQVEDEFLSRVEPLFSLTDNFNSIGSSFNAFFTALDDLSANPASIELRANLIQRANDLTSSVQNTFASIASLQDEADQRIATEINTVNAITGQIAGLNENIRSSEASGNLAAGERDRREQLLNKLAEKLSFNSVEAADGSLNIYLSNGFNLVSGSNSYDLSFSHSPSFAAGTVPPSLSGQSLGHIVYDYSAGAGTAEIELTDIIAQGDGIIGGLLSMRGTVDVTNPANTSAFDANGDLVDLASRVEAVAKFLLQDFNTEYLGPDRDGGTAGHQPSSADLDNNIPSVYGLFSFEFTGAYDVNADGLPNDLGNHGLDNYASLLKVAITDPRDVAAGRDASGGLPAALDVPEGDNSNLVALVAMQTTDYTFSAGNFSLTSQVGEAYDEMVATLGNRHSSVRVNLDVAEASYTQAQQRRDEVSAVSLDEEFTDLIKFQRAFEAAARMIKVADELLQQIVNVI